MNPNPYKLFIQDLVSLIEEAVRANQDIIFMRDFNEAIRVDARMMAIVLTSGRLTDILYANRHANDAYIATYIRGKEGSTTICIT